MAERWVETSGGRFPVGDEGRGGPVLALHGFPDTRAVWRRLSPLLVAGGHRVIAPDLLGFGGAPRPERVESYEIPEVVGRLTEILDELGVDRCAVLGHDWGAATAWWMAALEPERVERLAVVSVGHPMAPSWRSVPQREKTWYFWLFSSPEAERTLLAEDAALLREWMGGEGDAVDAVARFQADPGALTSALAWYRANARAGWIRRLGGMPPVRCPVLGIWSDGDRFLLEPQMIESGALVEGPWSYARVDGASHWAQLDAPERLAPALLDFFAGMDAG